MRLFTAILATLAFSFHDAESRPPIPAPLVLASDAVGQDGIIGSEDRKLLPDFTVPGAADQAVMRQGLAATQRVSCGASASLIYRSDVIIFSSHQLLDHGKPDPDVEHCFFVVARTVDGVSTEERYPLLLDTLDHGVLEERSFANDDAGNIDDGNDWSIVRLARPVAGIEPYRLPDSFAPTLPGTEVATVSKITDNWKGQSKQTDRLAQLCHVIDGGAEFAARFPAVLHFDCDVGGGASGGAVLGDVASGAPRYVATTIAYSGNQCRTAGVETCFSIGRRLDAELAARIRGTTALGTGAEDAADRVAQQARLAAARDRVAGAATDELSAPFPQRDDSVGREVAALRARISDATKDGRDGETDQLYLAAYEALNDPGQDRPEWPRLWIENGNALDREGRRADAFLCFEAALALADPALQPYARLRMAETEQSATEREKGLRAAYLAGGEALFRLAHAEADLAAIAVDGVPTTPDPDANDD